MNVVPFKRPEDRNAAAPPPPAVKRSFAEFATAMAMIGVVLFMLPTLWSGFPQQLLAVIHLLVAVVYVQQGPRIAAGVWIGLTVATLVVTGAPSPIVYLLARGASAVDAALTR